MEPTTNRAAWDQAYARVESALREENEDDIAIGLFGKDETGPMPAAQAPTEKIPTRRAEPPPSQG